MNGIISPNEYNESIDKINQNFPSKKQYTIAILILTVITLVFTIIWATAEAKLKGTPLDYNATTITILVVFCLAFSMMVIFVLSMERAAKLRKTIAEESAKYSSRSPTPCGWRLETTRYFMGRQGTCCPAAAYQVELLPFPIQVISFL